MSKPLAGYYGQKSIRQSQRLKPQEYTVLGVNQPIIAPESRREPSAESQAPTVPAKSSEKGKFWVLLLLHKLL